MATHVSNRQPILLFAAAAILLAASGGMAPAQSSRPGDTVHLTAISLSLRVGNTEQDTRRVTYTPPPGWVIRSHAVRCTYRYGNTSYSISTVPSNWAWFSEE